VFPLRVLLALTVRIHCLGVGLLTDELCLRTLYRWGRLDGMVKPPRPLYPLQEMFGLHLEASLRRDALLEECRQLRDAGKKAAAKRCLAAAEELQALLTELEYAVRPR
jgi:hypothetical protein